MRRLVSHAANGEDVVLHRALRDVPSVTYADVGAGHPGIGSLTASLYALGWRGIHVEPVPSYARELREQRPDDVVFAGAAGTAPKTFWFIPHSGLSTSSSERAMRAKRDGWEVEESTTQVRALSELLDEHLGERTLHVLRVDAAGDESDVLASAALERHRPWLVVVRADGPGGDEPSLAANGYLPALFDGVNQWYVAADHPELLDAVSYPACSRDPWVLAGVAFPDPPTGTAAEVLSAAALQLAVAHGARAAAEAETKELRTQLRDAQADLGRQSRLRTDLERTVTQVKQEAQRAARQNEQMARSASWRLTKPLRGLGRLGKGGRPRRTSA